MLELDESLFVEHKSDVREGSSYGLASTVASFANTLGGWLLIGVRNGKPHGEDVTWATGDRPTLVDTIRDRLRGELDPLPAFEATVVELADGPVAVVRVYESNDTPHVSIGSGSVFVREVAGVSDATEPKRPGAGSRGGRAYRAAQIRGRAQLLDLSGRGVAARERVNALVDPVKQLPLVAGGTGLAFEPNRSGGVQPSLFDRGLVVVRIAPLTLPSRFRGWATTAAASAAVLAAAEELALRRGLAASWATPHPSGVSIAVPLETGARHSDGARLGLDAEARIVLDGAGVAAAALHLGGPADEGRRSWIDTDTIATHFIEPVAMAAVHLLESGEFLGRAWCQVDLVNLSEPWMIQGAGNHQPAAHVPTGADITLPLDPTEMRAVAQRAANAVARSARVAAWDPPAERR